MFARCLAFGLSEPEIRLTDGFAVTIRRKNSVALEKVSLPAENTVLMSSGGESKLSLEILSILAQGALSKKELAYNLGKNRPSRYLDDLIARLVKQGLIGFTIPEKPNSRLQKYRLSQKGKHIESAKREKVKRKNKGDL